jgi:CheY-like chemotaxis protein
MSRILLVHWNEDEARERAAKLAKLGHEVATLSDSKDSSRFKIATPPELFVIDLARIPSHGREVAGYFRRQKTTRNVPILFVGGDSERVENVRKLLPDASFVKWTEIKAAIAKAIRSAPKVPVVPGTMAGYSGTPLPKKLGIRANCLVALVNAPEHFERKLGPLPPGAEIGENANSSNVVLLFARSQTELVRDFRSLVKSLREKVALWIAWPKQTSGVATDLKEGLIREFGLGEGWVDYKICAIDETWSGLCFARRKS